MSIFFTFFSGDVNSVVVITASQLYGLIIASLALKSKYKSLMEFKKMGFINKIIVLSMLCSAFLGVNASAGIINSQFEVGATGWIDLSTTGAVVFNGGVATFSGGEGESPYSASLIQGDDGSFGFASPISISSLAQTFQFDLWLFDKFDDLTESGESIFSDSFSFAFYDAVDATFDLTFSNLDFFAGEALSFDISSLAGRNVAVYFELRDENDGFNLEIGLDNLLIKERVVTTVSESSSLLLAMIGMLSLWCSRRTVTK